MFNLLEKILNAGYSINLQPSSTQAIDGTDLTEYFVCIYKSDKTIGEDTNVIVEESIKNAMEVAGLRIE